MLNREMIEAALIVTAEKDGHKLNGQDRLVLRTRIAASLAAKERYRQRMRAEVFEWKKPQRKR